MAGLFGQYKTVLWVFHQIDRINAHALAQYIEAIDAFKSKRGLIDFTDMLVRARDKWTGED